MRLSTKMFIKKRGALFMSHDIDKSHRTQQPHNNINNDEILHN